MISLSTYIVVYIHTITQYLDEAKVELLLTTDDEVESVQYAFESYPQCSLYNGQGGADDHLVSLLNNWIQSLYGRHKYLELDI